MVHNLAINNEPPRLIALQSGDLSADLPPSHRSKRRIILNHPLQWNELVVSGVVSELARLMTTGEYPTAVRNAVWMLSHSVHDRQALWADAKRRDSRENTERLKPLLVGVVGLRFLAEWPHWIGCNLASV